jgi:hypothetical protein
MSAGSIPASTGRWRSQGARKLQQRSVTTASRLPVFLLTSSIPFRLAREAQR